MSLAVCANDVKFLKYPGFKSLGHYEPVNSVNLKSTSWNCTGELLVVTKTRGYPIILNTPVKSQQSVEPFMEIQKFGTTCSTFTSSTKDHVALGDEDGVICVYDIARNVVIRHFSQLPGNIERIEFSLGDRCMAASVTAGDIYLFDSTRKPSAVFLMPSSESLSCFEFSKQHPNYLAGASKEGIVCIWDTESKEQLLIGKNHDNIVSDMSFSENTLTTAGVDGKCVIYDMRTFNHQTSFNIETAISTICYIPERSELVVGTCEGQIRSYDDRYLSAPMNSISFNTWIKQIRCQPTKPNYNFEDTWLSQNVDDHFTSGDFLPTSVSNSMTNPLEKSYIKTETTDSAKPLEAMKSNHNITPIQLKEFAKQMEDRLKQTKAVYEDKLLQTFYALRISASKRFISLEDRVNQSWASFVDLIKSNGSQSNVNDKSSAKVGSINSSDVKSMRSLREE